MYHEFYSLKETPFNVTADPDFFFSSKSHTEAISNLLYGIDQRKGILVITGEVGTGKTTLCKKLLRQATNNSQFALILNPKFSELQLLQMVLQDLGIHSKQKNKFVLIKELNAFLISATNKGQNVILIIDEAQNLSVTQLEQIRLLSNLETEKEKLLQIVLIGQPELYHKLQLPALRQLRQRIAIHYDLKPLEKHDIRNYIYHRIQKAAHTPQFASPISFSEQAIESIFHITKGSPRSINLLCDRALVAGYVADTRAIDDTIIKDCAKEVMYFEHHL